mgnify:FL=1
MKAKPHISRPLVGLVLALLSCTSLWAALPNPAKAAKPANAATDNASNRLSDHEARRAKFQQLCANPTPSQRETLQIWAKTDSKIYGPKFCADVEYRYFGTKDRPKTWHTVALLSLIHI